MAVLIRTLDELSEALRDKRPAFVPTMGALHEGHLALIRCANEIVANRTPVVVSIFVNPTQFGPNEDYTRYPRMLEKDSQAAFSAGADLIFAPDVDTVYPKKGSDPIIGAADTPLPSVATQPGLEDAQRPTHFTGVCRVVARLFDLIQPGTAIFGEKDFQQLLVIKAMVAQAGNRWNELRIIAHPTVREPDGLAMSSRNAYLEPAQRDRALGLSRALNEAKTCATPCEAEARMEAVLKNHDLSIDYAVVRDSQTLMPIEKLDHQSRGLIAVRLGAVRLIDNMAMR